MFIEIIIAVSVFAALAAGFGGGYLARKQWAQNKKDSVEAKIEKLLLEAKAKQREMMLQAQEKSLKIVDDAKVEAKQVKNEMDGAKKRLENREAMFDQKL